MIRFPSRIGMQDYYHGQRSIFDIQKRLNEPQEDRDPRLDQFIAYLITLATKTGEISYYDNHCLVITTMEMS